MQPSQRAARAYQAATGQRSWREQEADVFRRASGVLRDAIESGPLKRVRAIADNRRLWSAVMDLVRDPENSLPDPLRAGILSLGHTVQREMEESEPNYEFLAIINEHLAAGLSGTP